ncbi:MAG: flagellar filament capping protein FliD [Planctomycetes bacterium]|nr:flagellar filament capping protein FliD [Planctomycetota bacterium]
MSSAGISFGGLASGLDTKAIISALVAVEQRPITQLQAKKTSLTKQKSLFGDLKGLLDKLTTAAKALKSTTEFLAMKATSSDEDVLKASASSSATPGSYTFTVERLATGQVNATTGSASATAAVAAVGFEFTLDVGGNQVPITTDDPPTLQGIANQINAAGQAVRAQVIDTGNQANGGANRYQLVLSATEIGSAGGFSLSIDPGEDPTAIAFVNDLSAGVKSDAQDAKIVLNGGIEVYRSSNTVSDLFNGLTLDLKATSTTPVTVTVSTDAEETSKKVEAFVEAYNKVVDFMAEQNKVSEEGKASGPLFGDVTLRSIRSSLRNIVGGQVETTGNEAYQLFSQIGITSDRDGKLTFNKSKFEEALGTDENAVANIFTDATNGISTRLETQIDLYTDSVDGLIKARSDGFDRQVKNTTDRIDQAERRLELYQKQLEVKYANLESLLSKLQGQGSGLSSLNNLSR